MGAASGPSLVTQTAFTYTATSSVFSFDVAGLVTLTATFLSPVYPSDLVRQSTLFSYVQLAAASADGKAHSVQVYSDISGGTHLSSLFMVSHDYSVADHSSSTQNGLRPTPARPSTGHTASSPASSTTALGSPNRPSCQSATTWLSGERGSMPPLKERAYVVLSPFASGFFSSNPTDNVPDWISRQ